VVLFYATPMRRTPALQILYSSWAHYYYVALLFCEHWPTRDRRLREERPIPESRNVKIVHVAPSHRAAVCPWVWHAWKPVLPAGCFSGRRRMWRTKHRITVGHGNSARISRFIVFCDGAQRMGSSTQQNQEATFGSRAKTAPDPATAYSR